MSRRIDFYYDIVSPYTYIGFEILCRHKSVWDLAINFRPFTLAGVMKGANNQSPAFVPAKGNYLPVDLARLAKHCAVPLRMAPSLTQAMFVKGTLPTVRFITAVQMRHSKSETIESLSRQLFLRLFSQHQDVTEPASLREAAQKAGLTAQEADAALAEASSDAVKAKLKATTDEALAFGAFGSPTFVVHTSDGKKEMVFGSDRFHIIGDLLGVEYKGPLKHLAKL